MELIQEIYEKDLGLQLEGKQQDIRYKLRRAARALLFRGDTIAILAAEKLQIHKLPGGGIDAHESISEGLEREILEETGCKIGNIRELGITVEQRDSIALLQFSYVFCADVVDDSGKPSFTEKEAAEGFRLQWMRVSEALDLMKQQDSPVTYAAKFIHARDLAILEYWLRKNI